MTTTNTIRHVMMFISTLNQKKFYTHLSKLWNGSFCQIDGLPLIFIWNLFISWLGHLFFLPTPVTYPTGLITYPPIFLLRTPKMLITYPNRIFYVPQNTDYVPQFKFITYPRALITYPRSDLLRTPNRWLRTPMMKCVNLYRYRIDIIVIQTWRFCTSW